MPTSERKATGDSTPVMVRLPADILEAVDAARREMGNPVTRPELIRQVLTDWMASRAV